MRAKVSRRRNSASVREPVRRPDPNEAQLWRFGSALTISFTVAVLGLACLTWLTWLLLGWAGFRRHGPIPLHDEIGVLQLVFASVAGAGALVALVVAYRRQKLAEATAALDKERWQATKAHDRTRLLNERFTAITTQFGDEQAAVRLAGVHAMAGLADDWEENRQTCIDVLCAYLRMPYQAYQKEEGTTTTNWLNFRAFREVRHTVIRVIAAHLRNDSVITWQGMDFDFTGVIFDGGDFSYLKFNGSRVSFKDAEFADGTVSFEYTEFSGGSVNFEGARFSDGTVSFEQARFSGAIVSFNGAEFSGATVSFFGSSILSVEYLPLDHLNFAHAKFSGGTVTFNRVEVTGPINTADDPETADDLVTETISHRGPISFEAAEFSGGTVTFDDAKFSGGEISFHRATVSDGVINFRNTFFSGSKVTFSFVRFSGGTVRFCDARGRMPYRPRPSSTKPDPDPELGRRLKFCGGAVFLGGMVSFDEAEFSDGTVSFGDAKFSGGTVNFDHATFSGGSVVFDEATFLAGMVSFFDTYLPAGTVSFNRSRFDGGAVDFNGAVFSGANVDFSNVATWSHPPNFYWAHTKLPAGVKMPGALDQESP